MNGILPWQGQQWRQLRERHAAGRLPHALLLAGVAGTGKRQFATSLAGALLCRYRNGEGFACGDCPACIRFRAGSHPDFMALHPRDEGRAITVDQARAVGEFLAVKSHYEGGRVVLLAPADSLNRAAANCLLKTLEEPAPDALLLLVTNRPGALPATIRSRCQRVGFAPPARHVALEWLAGHAEVAQGEGELLLDLAAGAPLEALRLAGEGVLERRAQMLEEFGQLSAGRLDPVPVARLWLERGDAAQALFWLNSWVLDVLRLKQSRRPPLLANRDRVDLLGEIAQHTDSVDLVRYLERVVRLRHQGQIALNMQLQLEELLVAWSALVRPAVNP